MIATLEIIATYLWANRQTIMDGAIKYGPLVAKWIPRVGEFLQYLPQAEATIKTAEPYVNALVASGFSPGGAVVKLVATTLKPHAMTFEEEQAWMNRQNNMGGGG